MKSIKNNYFKKIITNVLLVLLITTSSFNLVPNIKTNDSFAIDNTFSMSDIPQYNGTPFAKINNNTPYFIESELVDHSYETYSKLDSLGRCGVAKACIGKDIMPKSKRGRIGMVKPSGWHTVKYNGIVEGNYLYNRCHLIAYCLAGENANRKNLITGTRFMNTKGMEPFELKVKNYVKRTNNHVLYRVTPCFKENNLLANGVLMEAKSVEDKGKGISFCVYCYNVQPKITIDYVTGNSALIKQANTKFNSTTPNTYKSNDSYSTPAAPSTEGTVWVPRTGSKYHSKPTCGNMKNPSSMSRSEAESRGFTPCKRCN